MSSKKRLGWWPLGTMPDTETILNGLIGTILNTATLDFSSMSYAHSTLHCLILTTVMRTTFDLGAMFHTHASSLCLTSASAHRAIGMSPFLTSWILNLGPMTLTNTPLDSQIRAAAHSAELADFLCTVLAAAATLLGEAVTSAERAAIHVLSWLLLLQRLRRRGRAGRSGLVLVPPPPGAGAGPSVMSFGMIVIAVTILSLFL